MSLAIAIPTRGDSWYLKELMWECEESSGGVTLLTKPGTVIEGTRFSDTPNHDDDPGYSINLHRNKENFASWFNQAMEFYVGWHYLIFVNDDVALTVDDISIIRDALLEGNDLVYVNDFSQYKGWQMSGDCFGVRVATGLRMDEGFTYHFADIDMKLRAESYLRVKGVKLKNFKRHREGAKAPKSLTDTEFGEEAVNRDWNRLKQRWGDKVD